MPFTPAQECHKVFLGRTADGEYVYAEIALAPAQMIGHGQTVDHEPIPADALELAVTHELRSPHGSDAVSVGASTEDFGKVVEPAPGLSLAQIDALADLADAWHLNGMRSGCAHVPEPLWEDGRYGRQPDLANTPACPETGYRWGSASLYAPLPEDVLEAVRWWLALDNTETDEAETHFDRLVHQVDLELNLVDGPDDRHSYQALLTYQGRRLATPFSTGLGWTAPPTAADVLASLLSDAAGYENTQDFDDWVRDYGYEMDEPETRRQARRTYDAVERKTAELRQFLGEQYQTFLFT